MGGIWSGFLAALQWDMMLFTLIGVVAGVTIGALPGLTSTMGVALLIPLTFGMRPEVGLAMLGGIYCASTYGGAITAILINIPGTPSACATVLDGYPLARKGEATRAISVATIVSCLGGLFSTVCLLFLAPPLAQLSLRFGAPEYFLLAVFGITIIVSLSEEGLEKGLISGVLGLLLSVVGMHPLTGYLRFTFGQSFLFDGVPLVVALIGLFSIPEVLELVSSESSQSVEVVGTYTGRPLQHLKEALTLKWLILRSSIIGVIIGIIPGAGTDIAAFLAYNEARRASKTPDEFGKGAIEGVAAAECANNAVTGGSLIPLLTLGVPGNAVSAIFLGGLLIHGLRPGAALFAENATITYGFIFSLFLSNILFVPVGFIMARYATRILRTPRSVLAPAIVVLAVIGSLAIRGLAVDVFLMLGMGLLGCIMKYNGMPAAPMVLGLVLGTMAEGELARALAIVRGDVLAFLLQLVTRPICIVVLALCVLSIWQGISNQAKRKRSVGQEA